MALLNSSAESAQAAVARYGLPATTRAYGDPAQLAADADVELVVDVTRVDKHYTTVLRACSPAKAAFVEWPLADSIENVRHLAALAREKGIRTAVGIQGRLAPVFLKIGEVLASGRIGKVLKQRDSRIWRHYRPATCCLKVSGTLPREKPAGNPYTIGFGHCKGPSRTGCLPLCFLLSEAHTHTHTVIDSVQFILGDLKADDTQARFQLQRPTIKLRSATSGEIVGTTETDVPRPGPAGRLAAAVGPGDAGRDAFRAIPQGPAV